MSRPPLSALHSSSSRAPSRAFSDNGRQSRLSHVSLPSGHGRGSPQPAVDESSVAIQTPSTARSATARLVPRPSTTVGRKSRTTATFSVLGLGDSQSVVCAISEARAVSPTVGVAFVNVSLGEAVLSQICDNQSYVKTIHKIQIAAPSFILFMSTACPPNAPSTLFSLIQHLVPEAQLEALDRSAWSEAEGLDLIQDLAPKDDIEPLKVATRGKYYAISSFAAAMKYIQQDLASSFSPHSLRIQYKPSEDTMMIDISAIQSLEIMQNLRKPKSKESLFGLLNHTCTPMGSRMLRSNILQPPTRSESIIIRRYDALEELTTNEEMFREIRKALKLFDDVERLLTKLIIIPSSTDIQQVEEQINQVLMIKSFLEAVPKLHTALLPAKSSLLVMARLFCRPELRGPVLEKIYNTIEADVTFVKSPLDLRNQRTFAVKTGINGMLDVARQTYKELTEEVHKHIDEVNEQYGLNAVLKFDNGRRYWIRLNAVYFEDRPIPPIFINAVRKKDKIECQTLGLVKLNLRLSGTSNEVVIRSDAVIQALVKELRQEAPNLFRICESVALIDMISSFGQLATTRDYVRPQISSAMALKAARHPILDKITAGGFVPNDYYSSDRFCFHIVTRCNMSGKSTYIRAVALLQIMAQIGSFVPAELAAFSIVHNIFARVSLEDNIESNLSTFSVEMREMAFILRNVDDKSLAVIDELGRATSTRDGLAIAIAMSEALVQSKASVWFATHFADLREVLADRPGVLNLHLAADSSSTEDGLPQITMLYKATTGKFTGDEHYGINLARAIGLPQSFIMKAEEAAMDLRRKKEASKRSSESNKLLARRNHTLHLYETLTQAREHGTEETLPGFLKHLQEDFINRMEEIDNM